MNPQSNSASAKYMKIYFLSSIITKDCQVGEVVERFQEAFGQVKEHQNTKIIQAAEFQTDINHPKKRVLQIYYAMVYQCEL